MMNLTHFSLPFSGASDDRYLQRLDLQCCAVVERGILVQSRFNTMCAIEYLKSHNVAPQVIARVLLHPEQRRKLPH